MAGLHAEQGEAPALPPVAILAREAEDLNGGSDHVKRAAETLFGRNTNPR
jgi:hypothetical protein